jgi:hypothetical protein
LRRRRQAAPPRTWRGSSDRPTARRKCGPTVKRRGTDVRLSGIRVLRRFARC